MFTTTSCISSRVGSSLAFLLLPSPAPKRKNNAQWNYDTIDEIILKKSDKGYWVGWKTWDHVEPKNGFWLKVH